MNLISFINIRIKSKNKKHKVIRLKNNSWSDYFFTILNGLIFIGLIYFRTHLIGKGLPITILLILVSIAMFTRLIQSDKYIIINAKGMKYNKLIKWDSIKQIQRDDYIKTDLIFTLYNKKMIIDFYSEEKIEELKLVVKRYSLQTYELHLAGL
jgi:ABC-type microcin C transport system permease subunit YejE